MQPEDALFPILFWILALYLCRPQVWRQENWRDRRVLGSRVFGVCMAISLTLQAHPLSAYFDALVGMNNLSWLLGYMNAVVAIYAGTSAIASIRNKILPTWLSLVSVGALVLFLFLAPWLFGTGEEFHTDLPHSLPLLLLREVLYGYIFIIASFCFRTFRQWIATEEHPTGRIRGSILLFAFSSVMVFAVVRGLASIIVYLQPAWQWYMPALKISNAVLIFIITAIVLGLAPVSWLRLPVRIMNYIEQHRALRDLERIRKKLVRVTGRVPWAQPAPADRWFNLPFVLYCACIDILDRRMLLQTQMSDGSSSITNEHAQLAKLLDQLPDTPDWVELVQHLRHVARKI